MFELCKIFSKLCNKGYKKDPQFYIAFFTSAGLLFLKRLPIFYSS